MANTTPKYELIPDAASGLFRLRALRDIPSRGVVEGTLGGIVAGPDSLSQAGLCWVTAGAMVLAGGEVLGDALVTDRAVVTGNAGVSGAATVSGSAIVTGTATVTGTASTVTGTAVVAGADWVVE